MPYRVLGRTGERVSAIGLGGWHLGFKQLDERVTVWRVRHFKVVQRTIGGDVIGTQGTPVEVMGRLIHHSFFPELWDVRNELTQMNLPE